MKQHILNFVLVLVIAIGGIHLMQPPTAQAQQEACTVVQGEDACTECKSEDCEEGDGDCGLLQEQGDCEEEEDCEWIVCKESG